MPQLLRNVRIVGGKPLDDIIVRQAIESAEAELGARGRLVIRPSGTEPLIRVMAEGDDRAQIERIVGDLVGAISMSAPLPDGFLFHPILKARRVRALFFDTDLTKITFNLYGLLSLSAP